MHIYLVFLFSAIQSNIAYIQLAEKEVHITTIRCNCTKEQNKWWWRLKKYITTIPSSWGRFNSPLPVVSSHSWFRKGITEFPGNTYTHTCTSNVYMYCTYLYLISNTQCSSVIVLRIRFFLPLHPFFSSEYWILVKDVSFFPVVKYFLLKR